MNSKKLKAMRKIITLSVLVKFLITSGFVFSQSMFTWENGQLNSGNNVTSSFVSYSINGSSIVSQTPNNLHYHEVDSVSWTRQGNYVLKTYLDGSNRGTGLDFGNRSEIALNSSNELFTDGDEHFFEISFRPDNTWDAKSEYGIVITQWKMNAGGPHAVIKLSNEGDYRVYLISEDGNGGHYFPETTLGYASPNAWTDLKVYFKKSMGSDGIIKVYVNGQLTFEHYGQNIIRDNDGYVKFGMYNGISDERVLYFDQAKSTKSINVSFNDWATNQMSHLLPNATPNSMVVTPLDNSDDHLVNVPISLTAKASDADGTVNNVTFVVNELSTSKKTFIQATLQGDLYTASWTPVALGDYVIRAKVVDNEGAFRNASHTISVTPPNVAPSVSLINPLQNSVNRLNQPISLSANASDSDGVIDNVTFVVIDLSTNAKTFILGAQQGNTYTATWTPTINGNYVIRAKATDNDGAYTNAAHSIVVNDVNNPPTATLINPVENSNHDINTPITLISEVTDDVLLNEVLFVVIDLSTMLKTFILATQTAGTDTYTTSWTPTTTGVYRIRV